MKVRHEQQQGGGGGGVQFVLFLRWKLGVLRQEVTELQTGSSNPAQPYTDPHTASFSGSLESTGRRFSDRFMDPQNLILIIIIQKPSSVSVFPVETCF